MTAEKSGEFRGKTVEAAINAGLASLKLSLDEVTVEVLRQGSRGVMMGAVGFTPPARATLHQLMQGVGLTPPPGHLWAR